MMVIITIILTMIITKIKIVDDNIKDLLISVNVMTLRILKSVDIINLIHCLK